jgi:hypothetical protein
MTGVMDGANMAKTQKHTFELRGRTEAEIDTQLQSWRRENAGRVFNVKEHPIKTPLPRSWFPGIQHRSVVLPAVFLMIIEYETKPEPEPKPKPKRKLIRKSRPRKRAKRS